MPEINEDGTNGKQAGSEACPCLMGVERIVGVFVVSKRNRIFSL